MTNSKSGDMLFGVTCDVTNCKYHGHDNRCFANNITVESPRAIKKAETFCGTFATQSSSS